MIIYPNRLEMLRALSPDNCVGAEIGVQRGEFSSLILATLNVRKLYLIDCWERQEGAYESDPSNLDQGGQDENFAFVKERFNAQGFYGIVEIIKGYSPAEIYDKIEKHSLDWAYLDSDHTYSGVMGDLIAATHAVKPGGIIFGHDFTSCGEAVNMGFGVVEAVYDFLRHENYKLIGVSEEKWASFAIQKVL